VATIGTRLAGARRRKFLTQEELAQLSGVKVVTISRIENDRQTSTPRLSTIRKLAQALDADPAWIMFGEELDTKKAAA
jgi:transcriptional regulator with XRE-family HTH domain